MYRSILDWPYEIKQKTAGYFFLIDSGAPGSYLSVNVGALCVNEARSSNQSRVATLLAFCKWKEEWLP